LPQQVELWAQGLGKLLAREQYGLISGGMEGVDRIVAYHFAAELALRNRKPLERWWKQIAFPDEVPYLPEGQMATMIESWTSSGDYPPLRMADAVVLLGGQSRVTVPSISRKALELGKPVFPVPGYKGDSDKLYHQMLSKWPREAMHPLQTGNFQALERRLDENGEPLRRLLATVLNWEPSSDEPPTPVILPDRPGLYGHTAPVRSIAFSPDGQLLATGSLDGTARLWDLSTGKVIRILEGNVSASASSFDRTAGVNSVAFSPAEKMLATGETDGGIRLWDVPSGQLLEVLACKRRAETGARGPKRANTGHRGQDQNDPLMSLLAYMNRRANTGHRGQVHCLAISGDGRTLASANADHTVMLWPLDRRGKVKTLIGHHSSVLAVAFAPTGDLLASTGRSDDGSGSIRLWSVTDQLQRASLTGHTHEVTTVVFAPNGQLFATGSADHTIKLWTFNWVDRGLIREAPRELTTLDGHQEKVCSLAFSPDGQILASSSLDGTVRLWNVSDYQSLLTLDGDGSPIWAVAISPDGQTLASTSQRPAHFRVSTNSPEAQTLALNGGDQGVKLWDLTAIRKGLERERIPPDPIPPSPEPQPKPIACPTHWVLVAGTGGLYPPELDPLGHSLARLLARENYGLITSSGAGIARTVADTFARELAACPNLPLENWWKQIVIPGGSRYFLEGQQATFIEGPPGHDEYALALGLADAVVLIGGRSGFTRDLGLTALDLAKPVFPIPISDGHGDALLRHLLAAISYVSAPESAGGLDSNKVYQRMLANWPEKAMRPLRPVDLQGLERGLDSEGEPLRSLLAVVLKQKTTKQGSPSWASRLWPRRPPKG
jgi:hypothetical protein